ncbi:MAG: sulfurtransferase [Nitrospirales bacterium]|nr:MAG: sulfurtransferase [Nitrospirales bacterium]
MAHHPAFEKLVQRVKEHIQEISVDEVREKQTKGEPFAFIDIREDHERRKGFAKGSLHIGRGILERDIEGQEPNKDTMIVLYCGGGYRSALAASNLMEMGYTKVRSMAGGYKAWKLAGYPLENGKEP